MKRTDVKCPVCGVVNRSLFLEETDGWFECECCGSITCLEDDPDKVDTMNTSICHYRTIKAAHVTA